MDKFITKNVVSLVFLVLVVMGGAQTPPGIAKNPSNATCKNEEFKKCYNLVHVCPKFCPDSCTVECASCKPICGPTVPPPDSESLPKSPAPSPSPKPLSPTPSTPNPTPSPATPKTPKPSIPSSPTPKPPTPSTPTETPSSPTPKPPTPSTPTETPSSPTPKPPTPSTPTETPSVPTPKPPTPSTPTETPSSPTPKPPTPSTPTETPSSPTPKPPTPSTPTETPSLPTPKPPTPSTPTETPSSPTPKPPTPSTPTETPSSPTPEPPTPSTPTETPSSPTPKPPTPSTPTETPSSPTPKPPTPSTPTETPSSPTPTPPTPSTPTQAPSSPTPAPATPSTPTPSSPSPTPAHPTPSTPVPTTPSSTTPTPTTPSTPTPTPHSPYPTTPSTPSPASPTPDSESSASLAKAKCKNQNYTQCYNVQHVCPSACPGGCEVDCVTCKPVCNCDKPGAVCQDPRFVGGDGITFYFHGKKDQDFCLVTDSNLHINGHFIGKRNQNMQRDFTWVQSIAIFFNTHKFSIGAQKTATWDETINHLDLSFDDESINFPETVGSIWKSETVPEASITRISNTDNVIIEVDGMFKITAKVVPITKHESLVHNYGITQENCFAHLDLGFKFYSLSDQVSGVLGQTYREDYVSRVRMGASMPVLGGNKEFATSSLFATDCSVALFKGSYSNDNAASLSDIELPSLRCSNNVNGKGVVCKR